MTDEISGWPSQERGLDPIIGRPGAQQFLGHAANHHDGQSTVGPEGNRIPRRSLPLVREAHDPAWYAGHRTAANPLGAGFAASLDGDDGGADE